VSSVEFKALEIWTVVPSINDGTGMLLDALLAPGNWEPYLGVGDFLREPFILKETLPWHEEGGLVRPSRTNGATMDADVTTKRQSTRVPFKCHEGHEIVKRPNVRGKSFQSEKVYHQGESGCFHTNTHLQKGW
jgi:hypothetical protein